jgi:hypothetical protein
MSANLSMFHINRVLSPGRKAFRRCVIFVYIPIGQECNHMRYPNFLTDQKGALDISN